MGNRQAKLYWGAAGAHLALPLHGVALQELPLPAGAGTAGVAHAQGRFHARSRALQRHLDGQILTTSNTLLKPQHLYRMGN